MSNNANSTAPAGAKKVESNTMNRVVNIILVISILFAIFIGFTAYVSKSGSGVPTFFGFRPFSVQTDSMSPTFDAGDLIIDEVITDASDLAVGDIITYWTIIEGEQVLNSHRITAITDYENYLYFDTKGDNNTIGDSTGVHQNDVVGRYLFKIPVLGSLIDFLSTGTGFLIVIVIPVFVFFVFQLVEFFKALFAYQREKMRLQMIEEQRAVQAAMAKEEAPAAVSEEEPAVVTVEAPQEDEETAGV